LLLAVHPPGVRRTSPSSMSSMNSMLTCYHDAAVKVGFRPPPGLPTPPGMLLPPGLDFELESAEAKMSPGQLPRLLGAGPLLRHKDKEVQVADTDNATELWNSDCSTADTAEVSTSGDNSPPWPCCVPCMPPEVYQPGRLLRRELQMAAPQVLHLADTIEEPDSFSPECPSVGSAGHHLGLCKPCDFVHRGSCRTGAACKFCHLCGPAENKQRKKEKRAAIRMVKRWQSTGPL